MAGSSATVLRHRLRFVGEASRLLLISADAPILALAARMSAGFKGVFISMTGKGTVDESAKAGQAKAVAEPSASASCAAAAAMAGCRVAKAAAAASAFVCKDVRYQDAIWECMSITLPNQDKHFLETCVIQTCCVKMHLCNESRRDFEITCALPSESEPSGASELLRRDHTCF